MASTGKEAVRSFSRPGLRRDAGLGDQVMELVAARYAQLGVGAVQVGGDGGPFLPRAAGNPDGVDRGVLDDLMSQFSADRPGRMIEGA